MHNKFLPSLVTGFAAGVLLCVPGVKTIGFFVIVPVAVHFAIKLNVKLNNAAVPVRIPTALLFGIMTALWAALFATIFDTIITLFTHNNDLVAAQYEIEKTFKQMNLGPIADYGLQILHGAVNDIKTYGFSAVYTFSILISNIFYNILFGIIGAFISRMIINKKPTELQ